VGWLRSSRYANAVFRKLAEEVQSLEEIGRPHPISQKVAAETIKRYLVDERNRIRLHDLVMEEASRVRAAVTDETVFPIGADFSPEALVRRLQEYEAQSEILMAIMAAGGYWGDDRHRDVWVRCLERLADLPRTQQGTYYEAWLKLRLHPALLAMYAGGIAAIASDRYHNLKELLTIPKATEWPYETQEPMVLAVNSSTVLRNDWAKMMPGKENHFVPFNDRLCYESGLREALRDYVPDDQDFIRMFDRFEYFLGLVHWDLSDKEDGRGWAPIGCFYHRYGAAYHRDLIRVIKEVLAEADVAGQQWAPLKAGLFDESLDRFRKVAQGYSELIERWR
jgi:hypothetical protein